MYGWVKSDFQLKLVSTPPAIYGLLEQHLDYFCGSSVFCGNKTQSTHARTHFTTTVQVLVYNQSWSITCNWPLCLLSVKGKQRDREKPPERFKTLAFKWCLHNVTQWISCTSAPTIHATESICRVGWTYSTLNLYWSVCLMACIIHMTLVYFPSGLCINNLFLFLLRAVLKQKECVK